jgi:hypothetical protein
MLDGETIKTYANSKITATNENQPGGLSYQVAETHDQSYTPLRPILSRSPGEVHGIA